MKNDDYLTLHWCYLLIPYCHCLWLNLGTKCECGPDPWAPCLCKKSAQETKAGRYLKEKRRQTSLHFHLEKEF